MTNDGFPALNVSPDAMKMVVKAAVLDMLTPEQRDAIVAKAVNEIVTKPDRYSSGRDYIQEAIVAELRKVCDEIAKEIIEADPSIKVTIRNLMLGALAMASAKQGEFKRRVGDSMAHVLNDMWDKDEC